MGRPRIVATIMAAVTAVITACGSGARTPVAAETAPSGSTSKSSSVAPDETGSELDVVLGPIYSVKLDTPDGRPSYDIFADTYSGKGTHGGQMREGNVRTKDGVLTISAHGEGLGGACLCGADAPKITYGIYEFSFRTSVGQGYIPVVLLWPEDRDNLSTEELWRSGGEFDIVEVEPAGRQSASMTLHWFEPWGSANKPEPIRRHITADFTSFRQIRVVFLPDLLAGYVDGREVFRETDPKKIPPTAMHLTAQMEWHWDTKKQPTDASRDQGTELQISDIRFRPVLGVSRNLDGSLFSTTATPQMTITIG